MNNNQKVGPNTYQLESMIHNSTSTIIHKSIIEMTHDELERYLKGESIRYIDLKQEEDEDT